MFFLNSEQTPNLVNYNVSVVEFLYLPVTLILLFKYIIITFNITLRTAVTQNQS